MINIGMIGCGYWGPNLVRDFNQIPECKVKTVCDLADKRLNFVRQCYPSINTTKDYTEILKDPEIDAVVIATPADSHYKISKESLLSSKHVFVEKPLCLSTQDCRDLIETASNKNKILMVGHTFEYNPAVRRLKEYIVQGELGTIYNLYSQRVNLGIIRQDVNVMWSLSPHDISITMYLLEEEPKSVSADGFCYIQEKVEDVVYMNLYFASGKHAHIHVSWLDPNKIRKMTVVGSKKMIVYDDVSIDSRIQIYDKGIEKVSKQGGHDGPIGYGEFQLSIRSGDLYIPKIDVQEPLKIECSHFIECLKEGKKPLTDGENGLRVVKVLEAAQKSLNNNGAHIEVK